MALHGSSSRGLSRQAYLLQWAYKAAAQPQAALEHMLLLGYRGKPSALFSVSGPRRQERKPEAAKRGTFQVRRATSNTLFMHTVHLWVSETKQEGTYIEAVAALMTFAPSIGILRPHQYADLLSIWSDTGAAQCFVFGPPQSGKSSLLRALTKPEEAMPPLRSSDVQARDGSRHDSGVTAVVPMQAEGAAGKLERPPALNLSTLKHDTRGVQQHSRRKLVVTSQYCNKACTERPFPPQCKQIGPRCAYDSTLALIAASRQATIEELPYCAGGSTAILILSEQSAADTDRLTAGGGAAELASCDLGVFLFDCSSLRSMQEALHLLVAVTQAANNSLPCVLLAAKDDLGMSQVAPDASLLGLHLQWSSMHSDDTSLLCVVLSNK